MNDLQAQVVVTGVVYIAFLVSGILAKVVRMENKR